MRSSRLAVVVSSSSAVIGALTQRAYAASCDITGGIQAGADCAKGNTTVSDLPSAIASVTNVLILVVGIASVLMIIIGGLRYVLSGGDEKGTVAAKDTILYAVIGVVVSLLAYSIVKFVIGKF